MSRRGLLVALIVSLALNLFVLGGLGGAMLMGWRPHDGPPPGPPRLAALGAAALTPEQRAGWEAAVQKTAESSAPKIHQARMLRQQAWRSLGAADPVNSQATLAALDQSRALELQARAEMDRAVVSYAASLPAAERRKLGEALSRVGRHPPRGPMGPGGPMAPWLGGRPAPGGGEPPLPDR